MTSLQRGLIVAAIHVVLVAGIGGKLLLDRATRPRVWVRTAPYDPDLPIRGRYVRLQLEAVPADTFVAPLSYDRPVSLAVVDGRLVAAPTEVSAVTARISARDGSRVALIAEPVAFFIPEHVLDPSIREPGEELWVEVTVPGAGPPRPIRLGIRTADGLRPLSID